jgi:hypothetical protein
MMLHSSNFRVSILASVMASHWQRTSDKEHKNECAIPTSSLTFLSCLSSENSSVRPKFPITSSPNPALRLGVHTDPTCMASDTNATSCRLSGSARDEAGEQHVKKNSMRLVVAKENFSVRVLRGLVPCPIPTAYRHSQERGNENCTAMCQWKGPSVFNSEEKVKLLLNFCRRNGYG